MSATISSNRDRTSMVSVDAAADAPETAVLGTVGLGTAVPDSVLWRRFVVMPKSYISSIYEVKTFAEVFSYFLCPLILDGVGR
jgi:hypothetical protein